MLLIGFFKFRIIETTHFSHIDKVLIVVFISWSVLCIFRSITIPLANMSTLPRFLGGYFYSPALLVPFFVFWGGNIKVLKTTWHLSEKFIFYFILVSPLLFVFEANYLTELIGFLPLLFLNKDKLSKKYIFYINLALLLSVVFVIMVGGRNGFVKYSYYFMIASMLQNRKKFKSVITFRIVGFIYLLVFGAGFIYMYSGKLSKHFTDKTIVDNIESYEKDNFNPETRNMVYTDFVLDFDNWQDLLLGRGALGTTYSPQFIIIQEITNTANNVFNFPKGHRLEIECGYLQVILKSGLIGLFLFVVIGLRAMYLGFFKTTNNFTIACGFIIFERFLSMYPYGLPSYSADYILFWLCVGACFSKNIRKLSNAEIYLNFALKKKYEVLMA